MKKILIAGTVMAVILFNFITTLEAKPIVLFAYSNIKHNLPRKSVKKLKEGADSKKFFTLKVNIGDKLGNVFTRTISYQGDGFTELVSRVGGTGVYTVVDANPIKPVFDGVFRYDGRPESKGRVEITDTGKTSSYNGNRSANTDGSGVMFNPLIWGSPPDKIKKGDTWTVNIPIAWELGGAGAQTVTVISIDESNNTVMLKREGNSEGFYDNDIKQVTINKDGKTVSVAITPGTSHWVGYTTFKNGLVISDELLVSRPVTLTAENLKLNAFEREYILLNAMPVS